MQSFISATALLVELLVLFELSRLVWNYIRLRHVPGPFIASLTNLWLLQKFWTDAPWRQVCKELHAKYGPVVRYGPNRVAFCDPATVGIILSTSKVLEKAESYDVMRSKDTQGRRVTAFTTIKPESRHTALKKQIAYTFSPGGVLLHETVVNEKLVVLIQKLEESGPVLNMDLWLQYFTVDTLFRIAFSKDLGSMEAQKDVGGVMAKTGKVFDYWHYWYAVPNLEKMIFKNPIIEGLRRKPSALASLAKEIIDARNQGAKPTDHKDLLGQYMASSAKQPDIIDNTTVLGLTVSTINAGFDTTSAAMTIFLYDILRNQDHLARLKTELDAASRLGDPGFVELNKLRYLDAAIKESMRLHTLAQNPFERVVSAPGQNINGVWIPAGTTVSVSSHVLHHDPNIWGEDWDSYNPARWIDVDEFQRRKMERAWLGFGAGKRMCLGQHIAWLEMKKVIYKLLTTFEMSLEHPERDLELGNRTLATPKELVVHISRKKVFAK